MLQNMRRLYPRGAANGGICVDQDGATLGPDCVLVDRTRHGFQAIERARALTLQKCIMGAISDDDWLFRQCQRISDALNKGETALAQIYGLRIPIGELDDVQLMRLAAAGFVKWSFNPDEPRVPKGSPQGGEWTTSGGSDAPADAASGHGAASGNVDDEIRGATADEGGGDDDGGGDDRSADALASLLDADPTDRISPTDNASGNASGSLSPANPAMQYQFIGPASGAVAPPGATAATMAAADTVATTLLGPLSAETLAGLAELAAQMSGPTLFLGILFIPSNGSPVVDGTVAGAPDLSTSYDDDTGVIQVWRDGGPLGGRILLDTGHIGVDGLFYDQDGVAIGRALPNGAIVDPDTLPGYRSQTSTAPTPALKRSPIAPPNQSSVPTRVPISQVRPWTIPINNLSAS
jgi:hypothetical protein